MMKLKNKELEIYENNMLPSNSGFPAPFLQLCWRNRGRKLLLSLPPCLPGILGQQGELGDPELPSWMDLPWCDHTLLLF